MAVLAFPDFYGDGVFTDVKSQGHAPHPLSEVLAKPPAECAAPLPPLCGGNTLSYVPYSVNARTLTGAGKNFLEGY